jgi:hypothetical protein
MYVIDAELWSCTPQPVTSVAGDVRSRSFNDVNERERRRAATSCCRSLEFVTLSALGDV